MPYVNFADPGQRDSFGRLRTSFPASPIDCKFLQDSQPYLHNEVITGGANITYSFNDAMVVLGVGTASGDRAVRESSRYAPYVPGNGTVVSCNGILGAAKTNVKSRIGFFNDNNGLFFERNGTDLRIVIRSNTSGTASDANFFTQSQWNIDKLDGTGSSGFSINTTNGLRFVFDFQWSFGRVRFGVDFGGKLIYCHEFNGANNSPFVYMRRPSLPVRYEILNSGVAASATTMNQCSYSVKTEGPNVVSGSTFGISHGIALTAVTTRQPVLALRLTNTYHENINRRQLRVENVTLYTKTNDCLFEFGHVHPDWISTTGGTWTAVDANSAAEYNIGITAITGGTQHIVQPFYVSAGSGSSSNTSQQSTDILGNHSWLSQNLDSTKSELAVIWATALAGTANVVAGLYFNEIE